MTRIENLPDTRMLPERSRLEFHYPDGETILFLPFYENPKITETGAANFVEYNPLARAGSLFVYTGAKSRKIKLSVNFTLAHLMEFDMGIGKFIRVFGGTSNSEQKLLFSQYSDQSAQQPPPPGATSIAVEVKKEYYAYRLESEDAASISANGSVMTDDEFLNTISQTQKDKAVDTLLFFIALLRSSILNNATDPLQGPPLVRLNFGAMYQSVPCIVKDYNIGWEEQAGYDLETLMPRRLNVSISLQEVRVGNFGKYEPATITVRDNITGWESVISEPHSTDPMRLTK